MSLYWVWLSRCRGVGPVTAIKLLERFGSPEAVYQATEAELERAGLSAALRAALSCKELAPAREILRQCQQADLRILTQWEDDYPAALRQTQNAPLLLYCRGTLPDPGRQPWIGIVGARSADVLGLSSARRLGWQIAGCGGVVVTGMAKGVDAEAAQGALDQGGTVIGVLGCGVDVVYPVENRALFAQVAACGCLLSEYPPGVKPNARHFPARNRIISALSDGVVVVQASEQSGALITARWAVTQGREIFAVPGPAGAGLSRGCNQLLREGAILTESGWDVMQAYLYRYPGAVREFHAPPPPMAVNAAPAAASASKPAPNRTLLTAQVFVPVPPLTDDQRAIVDALHDGPLQLDALIDRVGLPAARVLPQLTLLEIKRIILQKPGKRYEFSGGF